MQSRRASVLWTTQIAGAGTVTATAADGSNFVAQAAMQSFPSADTQLASAFYQYQADLTGLLPATEYAYSVTVNGQPVTASSAQFKFRTAPARKFSFLAFGDSGADSAEQQTLVQSMDAEADISMVVHVGDMAYPDGTFAELETSYYGVNYPLMRRLPFFTTPGNHEYNTDSAAPYLAGIATPASGVPAADLGRYYSFDWGNAHFVSIDSNLLVTARASAMLAWLDADLVQTKQHWRIVFLHHTPYPTGFHLGDPICAAVQQLVNPIVEGHGVQLVLAGHEHGYERTYPLSGGQPVSPATPSTTYIVTGGGGGALESVGTFAQTAVSIQAFHYLRVDVEGAALTIHAIGMDGSEIDQVTLGSTPEVSIRSVLSKGDYAPAIAPGSLVAISGHNLARANAAGASLTVDGQPAHLLSVSADRIEAQIPYGVSGKVALDLSTPDGFASTAVIVSPTAPSLLEIVTPGGLFSAVNPARPGDEISLYMTGLGELPLAPIEILLGHARLEVRSASLVPGHAAVYRVDAAIPKDVSDGVYSMRVVAGGVSSRPANLDVLSSGRANSNNRARTRIQR